MSLWLDTKSVLDVGKLWCCSGQQVAECQQVPPNSALNPKCNDLAGHSEEAGSDSLLITESTEVYQG